MPLSCEIARSPSVTGWAGWLAFAETEKNFKARSLARSSMDGHSHFAQLFPPALSSLFVIAERKQSWIYPSAITNKLLKTPLVFSPFERSQDPSLSPLFTYTLHLPRIELSNYQRNSRCERALCTALQREILITSARHYILSLLSPIFLPNTCAASRTLRPPRTPQPSDGRRIPPRPPLPSLSPCFPNRNSPSVVGTRRYFTFFQHVSVFT